MITQHCRRPSGIDYLVSIIWYRLSVIDCIYVAVLRQRKRRR